MILLLALPTTWVLRDGSPVEIETSFIVPGDVLILKNGVKVGADARIIDAHGLEADESQLTGESMGVLKNSEPIPEISGHRPRLPIPIENARIRFLPSAHHRADTLRPLRRMEP